MAQRTSSVAGEGSYLCLLSNEREVSMLNIKITDWLKKRAFFICKLQVLFLLSNHAQYKAQLFLELPESVAGEGSYLCLLSNEREVSMPNIKITDWLKKRAFFICKLQLFFPWPRELRV